MKFQTDQVFGVSNEQIMTYIEREKVDNVFIEGIKRNKHIVVYGASKQGKTALTNKHLKEADYIKVNCSYNSQTVDIYNSILRQLNFEFEVSKETTISISGEPKIGLKAKFKIPLVGGIEGSAELGGSIEKDTAKTYKYIEYNLELAQDVSELLIISHFKKRIILENFHYLTQETQRQLSIDLRVFEDYNILFIILGIWREKNRLVQYNGDLVDRLIEIPVEPWIEADLLNIAIKGEKLLNVSFYDIINEILTTTFDSVGVFQELCKEVCYSAGVFETSKQPISLKYQHLSSAIDKKLGDYSSRHVRAIESFVEQKAKSSDDVPLYIAYYFILVVLQSDFATIMEGFKRRILQDKIKKIHHRPDDVRASDIGYFLQNLIGNQIKKEINPPIFDYDNNTASIKIIDSTFYFFLRNIDTALLIEELPKPVGL